eukprot:20763-Eustigmatos_ZCMA.PRE.1
MSLLKALCLLSSFTSVVRPPNTKIFQSGIAITATAACDQRHSRNESSTCDHTGGSCSAREWWTHDVHSSNASSQTTCSCLRG